MCRLLAWVSGARLPLDRLVTPAELDRLGALGAFHGDGWGTACLAGQPSSGQPGPGGHAAAGLVLERSTRPAGRDASFQAALRAPGTKAGLVHLRRASPGLAVSEVNTHPFAAQGFAFIHNGTIEPLGALESLLAPSSSSLLRGDTDSERYFLALLERLAGCGDAVEAARRSVADIRAACGWHGLNAMLLGTERLVVICAYAHAEPTRAELVESMGEQVARPENGIERDHLDDYFGLRYRLDAGSLLVASTGAPDHTWQRLPPESVLACDLATGEVRLEPLAAGGKALSSSLGTVGGLQAQVVP